MPDTPLPIYCTGGCDACRDYARELGVPLIIEPPPRSPTMPDTLTPPLNKHVADPDTGVHRGPLPDESLTYACAECGQDWPCDVVTLAKAPLDVERLARAMVDADLDDIPEPDDIFDSMPEARLMAERIAAKYAEEPHDA